MKGIIFALLASIVWGSAPLLFKLGLRGDIPPLSALVYHNLSALLLALMVVLLSGERLHFPLRDVLMVAVGGVMSGFLGLYFFFKAVKVGEVSVVAPIASTSPLWASILAFALLGEALNPLRVFGILLVVCGIVLISLSSGK